MDIPGKIVLFIVTCSLTCSLVACGGGGGSGDAGSSGTGGSAFTTVKLKIASSGTPVKNLSGVSVTIPLSSGVTIPTDNTGKVISTAVIPSGVTSNADTIPADFITYIAPVGPTTGSITFVLVSSTAAGFGMGEFATVTVNVASGSTSPSGIIATNNFRPVDISGVNVSGLTGTIQ